MSVPDTETVNMMDTTNGKLGEGEGKWDKVGDFLYVLSQSVKRIMRALRPRPNWTDGGVIA